MTRAVLVLGALVIGAAPVQPVTGRPSIAIYHVADALATGGPLAPDRLIAFKGVAVHRVTDAADIAATSAAVDAARAEAAPAGAPPLDARWGLRFRTATGRFVHAVYLDASGRRGAIDGRAVVFRAGGALAAYLASHFGPA